MWNHGRAEQRSGLQSIFCKKVRPDQQLTLWGARCARRQVWLQLLKTLLKALLQMQVALRKVSVHALEERPNRFFRNGQNSLDNSADTPFVAWVKSSQQDPRRVRFEDGRCTAKRNGQGSPIYFQLFIWPALRAGCAEARESPGNSIAATGCL